MLNLSTNSKPYVHLHAISSATPLLGELVKSNRLALLQHLNIKQLAHEHANEPPEAQLRVSTAQADVVRRKLTNNSLNW